MTHLKGDIQYRQLTEADVGKVPLQHQGSPEEVLMRVKEIGSSAMLAFDGDQHVGQLQFRPFDENCASPSGLFDPLYWMDFQGHAPKLPDRALALFCYHVGQLDDTDVRDPGYFGRGIGTQLLDETIAWMTSAGFSNLVAKGLSDHRPVIEYMGGMPTAIYTSRGFTVAAGYHDAGLRSVLDDMLKGRHGDERQTALRTLVDEGVNLDEAAEVTVCVREFA